MNKANKWIATLAIPLTLFATVKGFEGRELTAYKDIVGISTVCDGITGKDVIQGKRYTNAECDALLTKHIQKFGNGVLECINVPISVKEWEAYTSFSYNVGLQAFCTSSLLRTLNNGGNTKESHIMACKGLYVHPNGKPAWSYADGKYVQGLQNRRVVEYNICMKGIK